MKKIMCIAAIMAGLFMTSTKAGAVVVYSFQGVNFDEADGPYTTEDAFSGTVTFALPLTTWNDPTPLAYSFTDGVDTFSSTDPSVAANSSVALVISEGTGDVTDWGIYLQAETPTSLIYAEIYDGSEAYVLSFACGDGSTATNCANSSVIASAQDTTNGGQWTYSLEAVPEPSSLGLLVAGMLGLTGLRRSRRG
jgi:hypothetical protein